MCAAAETAASYYPGEKHPMKPQRMRMTHELIKAYELDKWMDVYVSLTPCRLPLEADPC